MGEVALRARNIDKYFREPEEFRVLNDLTFDVERGEFLSLIGKSGSGKSTLLYVLSTMDTDYSGELTINGVVVTGQPQNTLASFRNRHIGFVFQFHYLLPEFTALENVMLPGLKLGTHTREQLEHKAAELLTLLDLKGQMRKPARNLSGGQQQRVAIARAMINEPSIIMGDEPTGNLDSKNSRAVFDILLELTRNFGQTIITVTHDQDFARRCDRVIELHDGRLMGGPA